MEQYTASMLISKELQPDETLLWSGLPKQGMYLKDHDAGIITFSLIWFGIVCFLEYDAITSNPFFALLGIPFVLVGAYVALGRFITDSKIRSHTVYGVTNKRIIFVYGIFKQRTASVDMLNISGLSLSEKSNGSGTIFFSSGASQSRAQNPGFPYGNQTLQTFELSENTREIYDIIIKAQSDAKRLPF